MCEKIRNFSRSPTSQGKELKDSVQVKMVGSTGGVLKLCLAAEEQYWLHLQLVRDMKSNKRGATRMVAAGHFQGQQGRQP